MGFLEDWPAAWGKQQARLVRESSFLGLLEIHAQGQLSGAVASLALG